jgi:hypothetical protein
MKQTTTEEPTVTATAARRIKYDRRHLSSVGPAAQKLAAIDGLTRYIYATACGYVIELEPPAFKTQSYITVNPDGSHD